MIVDDEPDAVELLTTLIRENCPLIKIAATANGSDEAIKKLLIRIIPICFSWILKWTG